MASSLENFVVNGKKILAAGVNFRSMIEARKLPVPKEPVIFSKPTSSYLTKGSIKIPDCFSVYEEIELGVIIGRKCKKVDECEAMKYIGGYCLALDLTAMEALTIARKNGLPWTMYKGFDTACPVSHFIPPKKIKDPHNVQLWCKINGELKQQGNTNEYLFNIPQLISFISQTITLEPNDLILTGTPDGVSSLQSGDIIEGGLQDIITFEFKVE